jgi:hypothetical protein
MMTAFRSARLPYHTKKFPYDKLTTTCLFIIIVVQSLILRALF